MLSLDCLSVKVDSLTLYVPANSIQYAGITSHPGTSRHRETLILRRGQKWKVVMIFGQASWGASICVREPLRPGGGRTQVLSLRCSQWGECHRQRLLQAQGSPAADQGVLPVQPQSVRSSQKVAVAASHPPESWECCARGILPYSSFPKSVTDSELRWQLPSFLHCSASGLCWGKLNVWLPKSFRPLCQLVCTSLSGLHS